jgi:ribosomal protein L37AE/L43A
MKATRAEPKLNACPFCGGEALLRTSFGVWSVSCDPCELRVYGKKPVAGEDRMEDDLTEAGAIAAWNRRIPTRPQEDSP